MADTDALLPPDGCGETWMDESDAGPLPDAVDLVREAADLLAVFSAHRFVRIDLMRREALADAAQHGRQLTDVVERGIRLELATALRITEYAADRLIVHAEALVHRYPAVLVALEGARITERHAELVVESLDQLSEAQRAMAAERALALAEIEPVGALRRSLRRMVDELRAQSLAERHEEALSRRRVIVEAAEDGMSWLMALLPSVEAHAAFGRMTAMAKVLAGREAEDRTLDQLRSDIVGDLLVEGESVHHPAEARGIRATVVVTVPVFALLDRTADEPTPGGSDQSAAAGGATRASVFAPAAGAGARAGAGAAAAALAGAGAAPAPAAGAGVSGVFSRGGTGTGGTVSRYAGEAPRVEGVGPISVKRARELCGGAAGWMRVLTHPETGAVLSVGRDLYRPPPALRRLVRWRADRCMAPGCGMPADRCDIDHTTAWEAGGRTELANLAPICRGHHLVKHHGGWRVHQVQGSGGALEWTSPSGRRYTVAPERRVPVFVGSEDSPAPF